MDQAKLFLSSFGGGDPGGDPGDPIGHSLRFRGAQHLTRTTVTVGNRTTWTWSGWVKKAFSGIDSIHLFKMNNGSQAEGLRTDGFDHFEWSTASVGLGTTSAIFRDPSAWYHIIIAFDTTEAVETDRVKFYVNGVRTIFPNLYGIPLNGESAAGSNGTYVVGGSDSGMQFSWEGYLAEVYFINGQALEPTTFGRLNDFNVWVPVRPEGLTFGPNGYYLDFSDPNDIGADRSPNGNHFTPVGFNTTKTDGGSLLGNDGTPANQQIALGTVQLGSLPQRDTGNRAQIYDIDFGREVTSFTQRYRTTNMENRWMQLFTSNTGNAGDWTQIDERQFGPAANAAYDFQVDFPTAARYLRITQTATEGATWQTGVWNIQFVDDIANPDYDLMQDSPTQNFATLNSINANITDPTDANLTAAVTTSNTPSSIGMPPNSGKYYFEAGPLTTTSSAGRGIGLLNLDVATRASGLFTPQVGTWSAYTSNDSNLQIADGASGTGNSIGISIFQTGQVMRVAYDSDTGEAWLGVNETWFDSNLDHTTPGTNPTWTNIDVEVFGTGYTDTSGSPLPINFGQKPFIYTQPEGFEALQTQNLPTATILDGRDHFQAITSAIDAIFYNEGGITGSVQQPVVLTDPIVYETNVSGNSFLIDLQESVTSVDVVWASSWSGVVTIWCSNDGNTWTDTGQAGATIDVKYTYSISGAPFRYVRAYYGTGFACGLRSVNSTTPILDQAQALFPHGLWWVKDRANDSTQHQLVDSVRGSDALIKVCPGLTNSSAYVPPSGQAIAWCWNAPDEMDATTRNSGNINVTAGRVNQEAGFSILEFEGNTADNQTIAHGLTQAPEFMIAIAQDNTNSIPCWHAFSPSAPSNGTGLLNTSGTLSLTHVDASDDEFFTISSNTAINSGTVSMYLWHSVPGYSKMGQFVANNSNDGPFVYLGFKPAFLLCKSATITENWVVLDSTRSPNNLNSTYLIANNTNAEKDGSSFILGVDFLSNGFKCRGNNNINTGTGRYVYVAFAENPFQSPATAQ